MCLRTLTLELARKSGRQFRARLVGGAGDGRYRASGPDICARRRCTLRVRDWWTDARNRTGGCGASDMCEQARYGLRRQRRSAGAYVGKASADCTQPGGAREIARIQSRLKSNRSEDHRSGSTSRWSKISNPNNCWDNQLLGTTANSSPSTHYQYLQVPVLASMRSQPQKEIAAVLSLIAISPNLLFVSRNFSHVVSRRGFGTPALIWRHVFHFQVAAV